MEKIKKYLVFIGFVFFTMFFSHLCNEVIGANNQLSLVNFLHKCVISFSYIIILGFILGQQKLNFLYKVNESRFNILAINFMFKAFLLLLEAILYYRGYNEIHLDNYQLIRMCVEFNNISFLLDVIYILIFLYGKNIRYRTIFFINMIIIPLAALEIFNYKWIALSELNFKSFVKLQYLLNFTILIIYVFLYWRIRILKKQIGRTNNEGINLLLLLNIGSIIYFINPTTERTSSVIVGSFIFEILAQYLCIYILFKAIVLETYVSIGTKMRQLEEEKKLQNDFLSNISHEFKTPLNVIYSALQVQTYHLQEGNYESSYKYLKSMRQNCCRLFKLIDNLIDTARIDNHYIKVKVKRGNIVSTVEELVMTVATYIKDKNLEIIFDTEEEEIYVLYDEEQIERVVLNLLSNAIKYNKKNGSINVDIKLEKNDVCISIRDTGIGIDKEDQTRIFDRFERIDTSLTRKVEGSGMGLNITKGIVELHHGEIRIASELNEGTCIEVLLPLCNELLEEEEHEIEIVEKDKRIIRKIETEFSDIYDA